MAREVLLRILQIALGLSFFLMAGLYFGRSFVPSIFTKDPAVIAIAERIFPILAFFMVSGLASSPFISRKHSYAALSVTPQVSLSACDFCLLCFSVRHGCCPHQHASGILSGQAFSHHGVGQISLTVLCPCSHLMLLRRPWTAA